ncbi:MAG TPA: GntR family transcriptional regulator [Gammaproteobacteria bacterium]
MTEDTRKLLDGLGTTVPSVDYKRPTPNQVFEYIRDEIISMQLLPGQKISENTLAEKFSVSRTPIREALNRLSTLGFVEVRPQRGTFVTKLSMSFILEARFIRESLEVAVVNQLAENRVDSMAMECEKILADQAKAAKKKDALLFQQLDDRFHMTLADATGFKRVGGAIELEKAHMDRVRNLSLVELTGQYEHVLKQHHAILDAIMSGSPQQAVQAMRTHMRDVFNILKIAPVNHPEFFV